MANLLEKSGQTLITYRDVAESHPEWSDVAIQDYIAQKQDLIEAVNQNADAIANLQFTVIETDADYQVLLYDDAINCDGTFDVTLIAIADAVDPIIVTSTNGTVSILADATIQGSSSVTT